MTWWFWVAVGAVVGATVALLAARELGIYTRTRRAITIDLTGVPLRDPDDWFLFDTKTGERSEIVSVERKQ